MSETTKSSTEAIKRSGQAGVDSTTKLAKENIGQTAQAAQQTTEHARDMGQSMTETVAETAGAAKAASSKAVDQGREVMMSGMRTAAGVSSHVADISFGRGQHMLASATHAMDICCQASERSADRVQAMVSSAMLLGRGIQRMQHAWLEMLDQTLEHAAHKPQDLLRCKNLVELAEVQRDLYLDAINHAFESSSRMLELADRTAQEAARPLQTITH